MEDREAGNLEFFVLRLEIYLLLQFSVWLQARSWWEGRYLKLLKWFWWGRPIIWQGGWEEKQVNLLLNLYCIADRPSLMALGMNPCSGSPGAATLVSVNIKLQRCVQSELALTNSCQWFSISGNWEENTSTGGISYFVELSMQCSIAALRHCSIALQRKNATEASSLITDQTMRISLGFICKKGLFINKLNGCDSHLQNLKTLMNHWPG